MTGFEDTVCQWQPVGASLIKRDTSHVQINILIPSGNWAIMFAAAQEFDGLMALKRVF